MAASKIDIFKSIRLNQDEIRSLLDRLDAVVPQAGVIPDVRTHERYHYRIDHCVIHLQQIGDSVPVSFFCPTRNLSAGGIAILHRCFVHQGSDIRIQLISRDREWWNIDGKVVGCRLVKSPVHEIRVKFNEIIDPSLFCADARQLTKQILLLDNDSKMCERAALYLEIQGSQVVRHLADVEQLAQEEIDNSGIILLPMNHSDARDANVITELRSRAQSVFLVVIAEKLSRKQRELYLKSGANYILTDQDHLDGYARMIKIEADLPLLSSESNPEEILKFLESLPEVVCDLEEAILTESKEDLEKKLRKLKASAELSGYDSIFESVSQIDQEVARSTKVSELSEAIHELVALCQSARRSLINKTG